MFNSVKKACLHLHADVGNGRDNIARDHLYNLSWKRYSEEFYAIRKRTLAPIR